MELIHCMNLSIVLFDSRTMRKKDESIGKRITQNWECDFILSADGGKIITKGEEVVLTPGMLFFREPGLPVEGIAQYSSWFLRFDTKEEISGIPGLLSLPASVCCTVFRALYDLHVKQPPDGAYLTDYYLNQILFLMYQTADSRLRTSQIQSSLEKSKQFMDSNWNKKLCLDDISTCSGYSKSRFCHLFQVQYQVSPLAYLQDLKLQHICYRLIESDTSVKELMLEAGFRNERSFFRLFKAKTGDTPLVYRRKHQMFKHL